MKSEFDDLNRIMPGLGDEFKKLMQSTERAAESMKDFGDAAGPIAGDIADAEEPEK